MYQLTQHGSWRKPRSACIGIGVGAVGTHPSNGQIKVHVLVAQRTQCVDSRFCRLFQVVGEQCRAQGAVAMAGLAFEVWGGMHARRHGLITAYALIVDAAQ